MKSCFTNFLSSRSLNTEANSAELISKNFSHNFIRILRDFLWHPLFINLCPIPHICKLLGTDMTSPLCLDSRVIDQDFFQSCFPPSIMSRSNSDLPQGVANLAAVNVVKQVLCSLSQIWGKLPNDRNISTSLVFLLHIRYLMFIKLKKLYPHQILIPMYDIDLIWHSHQLCTEAYQRDTINYLGKKKNPWRVEIMLSPTSLCCFLALVRIKYWVISGNASLVQTYEFCNYTSIATKSFAFLELHGKFPVFSITETQR